MRKRYSEQPFVKPICKFSNIKRTRLDFHLSIFISAWSHFFVQYPNPSLPNINNLYETPTWSEIYWCLTCEKMVVLSSGLDGSRRGFSSGVFGKRGMRRAFYWFEGFRANFFAKIQCFWILTNIFCILDKYILQCRQIIFILGRGLQVEFQEMRIREGGWESWTIFFWEKCNVCIYIKFVCKVWCCLLNPNQNPVQNVADSSSLCNFICKGSHRP